MKINLDLARIPAMLEGLIKKLLFLGALWLVLAWASILTADLLMDKLPEYEAYVAEQEAAALLEEPVLLK